MRLYPCGGWVMVCKTLKVLKGAHCTALPKDGPPAQQADLFCKTDRFSGEEKKSQRTKI